MTEKLDLKRGKVKTLLYKYTPMRPKARVNFVRLEGVISSSKKHLSLEKLNEVLEEAFEGSPDYVALLINSPGGSPVQSALIGNRIRQLAKEHEVTVLAYVEDVAASGGYWLACAADEIIAQDASIVGSIGVISGGFGFTEAMKKIGVERRLYTAGENKSFLDPFSEAKEDDIERLKTLQLDIHETFKTWVKSRRGDKIKGEGHFTGEFWTGAKALELGIIDKVSDFYSDMEARFGEDFKLKEKEIDSGFSLMKLVGLSTIAKDVVDDLETKGMRAKFGL